MKKYTRRKLNSPPPNILPTDSKAYAFSIRLVFNVIDNLVASHVNINPESRQNGRSIVKVLIII